MKLFAADLDFTSVATKYRVEVGFPTAVLEEADTLGDQLRNRADRRDVEFVTIDPPGSMDLDQAVSIQRIEGGYRVLYAIADVAAFVPADSRVAAESLRRGQTIYLPDFPARLHPPVLSEDRASLLPGVDRPCVLWDITLDERGEVTGTHVSRALIRSRRRFSYEEVQLLIDAHELPTPIALLPEVGMLRQESAARRKAINLRMENQRVERDADGHAVLKLEPRLPAMDYNSEISLLAGQCAGQMMAAAGVGILRTLRPAEEKSLAEFTDVMRALDFDVPEQLTNETVGEFLAGVDATTARGMAVMREAQKLLRGSGYVWLGEGEPQEHAGVGGYYSHVTAPLRRLVDRYAAECCIALCAGEELPEWVHGAPEVLETMKRSSALAGSVERDCLDLTEAVVLAPWVGTNFEAVVLENHANGKSSRVFVESPPVFSTAVGAPPVGTLAAMTLTRANPDTGEVQFAWPAD